MNNRLDLLQQTCTEWAEYTLGKDAVKDKHERSKRVLEEAIELCQSSNLSVEECHALIDYVYSRPKNENASQEIAGILVTVLVAAGSHDVLASDVLHNEIKRIHDPEIIEKVRRRQAEKRIIGHAT